MASHPRTGPHGAAASSVPASRKRNGHGSNTDSGDTMIYSYESDASSDDGFELVMSRRDKRRLLRVSPLSSTKVMSAWAASLRTHFGLQAGKLGG
ncbi:hypothetical protein HPB50_009498 [Hyalomma asiaticum]|uniref:Uncharacterized protein n=1 Tax=Hyalomma asiaticum TaxID=266040 RepID=A0ACB7RMP2_HYAAI|nr:hypothetical protein HPB50_009498 [Hyalomma asiaticum]